MDCRKWKSMVLAFMDGIGGVVLVIPRLLIEWR